MNDKTVVLPASTVEPESTVLVETQQQKPSTNYSDIPDAKSLSTIKKKRVGVGDCVKNRFDLIEIIGIGGMGIVYRARDRRQKEFGEHEPDLALKVLNDQLLDNESALMALQQECKKTQRLAHPNIVNVYDFDRDGDLVFFTMELLNGDSLDQLIYSNGGESRSYQDILPWVCSMGNALEYAHANNIVHSDFKPSNVFIMDTGVLKVFDFGIAKATKANKATKSDSKNAQSLSALTPAYASLGMLKEHPPKPSDDLYAFAIVIYLLLTGKHPYGKKTALDVVSLRLVPIRPEGLTDTAWRILKTALDPVRCESLALADFLAAFLPKARLLDKQWLLAMIGGLLVASLFAGYVGIRSFEEYRLSEKLVSGSIPEIYQTIDQVAALGASRQEDLLRQHRDEFILHVKRLIEMKIELGQFYEAQNDAKFMLGIYKDSRIILALMDVIKTKSSVANTQLVKRLSAVENRALNLSYSELEEWFFLLGEIKKIDPSHVLLESGRLVTLISTAVHSHLYSSNPMLAANLWEKANGMHAGMAYLLPLKEKINRYQLDDLDVSHDDPRVSRGQRDYPQRFLNLQKRMDQPQALSNVDISKAIKTLNSEASEFGAGITWAFARYLRRELEARKGLSPDDKRRYQEWLSALETY